MSVPAFFTEDSGAFLPTRFARSLWAPQTLNGPAVCALAARAADSEFGEAGFRAARFTVDLFKVAREVPTRTRATLIRDGRRIRVVDVDVVQPAASGDGEVVVARATTIFLRESTNPPGDRWISDDPFTPPQVDPLDVLPHFGAHGHPWSSDMATGQNGFRKRLWTSAVAVVAGEELTPFQRVAISSESTSLIANWGSTGIGFINCDLTVTMSRLPVGDRIGVDAESHTEHDGISASTCALYDSRGRFGTGMVSAVDNSAALIDFTAVNTTDRYAEG